MVDLDEGNLSHTSTASDLAKHFTPDLPAKKPDSPRKLTRRDEWCRGLPKRWMSPAEFDQYWGVSPQTRNGRLRELVRVGKMKKRGPTIKQQQFKVIAKNLGPAAKGKAAPLPITVSEKEPTKAKDEPKALESFLDQAADLSNEYASMHQTLRSIRDQINAILGES
jgi:hypothetical protein